MDWLAIMTGKSPQEAPAARRLFLFGFSEARASRVAPASMQYPNMRQALLECLSALFFL